MSSAASSRARSAHCPLARRDGVLHGAVGFGAVRQLMPYRRLLASGASWDGALALAWQGTARAQAYPAGPSGVQEALHTLADSTANRTGLRSRLWVSGPQEREEGEMALAVPFCHGETDSVESVRQLGHRLRSWVSSSEVTR
jgi:hypothetical protein